MRSHETDSTSSRAAGGAAAAGPAAGGGQRPGGRGCRSPVRGAVVRCEKGAVTLEDRHGRRRVFPLTPAAFLFEGKPVTLVRLARAAVPAAATRTASGSVAAPSSRARVARASRIYVEGRHDAELVEKIWGDDLRDLGVVVEHRRVSITCRRSWPSSAPGPGGGWACSWTISCRARRRAGSPPGWRVTASDRGAPVHRHLAGGEAIGDRDRLLAGGSARDTVEGWGAARHRLGRQPRRRLAAHPRAPSAPSPIWSRNSSAGWRSSSTSSPTRERADRARRPWACAGQRPAARPARRQRVT